MLKAFAAVVAVIFMMMIVAAEAVVEGEGKWSFQKATVRVQNELGTTLYIHCQSADTDLGIHNLASGQYVDWSFRANIRATTLFWCVLKWNSVGQKVIVYDAQKDEGDCAAQCWRIIRPDGAYFFHQYKNYWEKRYSW